MDGWGMRCATLILGLRLSHRLIAAWLKQALLVQNEATWLAPWGGSGKA